MDEKKRRIKVNYRSITDEYLMNLKTAREREVRISIDHDDEMEEWTATVRQGYGLSTLTIIWGPQEPARHWKDGQAEAI